MAKFLDSVGLNYFWGKVKTALSSKLDKTGGTLTGHLTGQYISGTRLRITDDNSLSTAPTKICVQQDGWIYTRTSDQLAKDLGVVSAQDIQGVVDNTIAKGGFYSKSEVDMLIEQLRARIVALESGKQDKVTTWGDLNGK